MTCKRCEDDVREEDSLCCGKCNHELKPIHNEFLDKVFKDDDLVSEELFRDNEGKLTDAS